MKKTNKSFTSVNHSKEYLDVVRDLHYYAIQLVVFSPTFTDKEKISYLKILCNDNEK